jgi:type I restriction enzyme, R subunit
VARESWETDYFEIATIERLKLLGYEHFRGKDFPDRALEEVVLKDILRESLRTRYPDLPPHAIEIAVTRISSPDGSDTIRRNKAFHEMLVRGIEVPIEKVQGKTEYRHVYPVDWDSPKNNRFLVVNQLSIRGKNMRRVDLLIYINGLPIALFELKNPFSVQKGPEEAFTQVQHYQHDIPQLFEFNEITVISDGQKALHGMWGSSFEWFAPWKTIDGETIDPLADMKTLIEGLFVKERLLGYIRNFIFFEEANEKIQKKGAKYHQFFAVAKAVEKTLASFSSNEKRLGVIWHTTGSGKSLSMVFLVGILRRLPALQNPTFIVQVDRTDLDNQLHEHFLGARSLVGDVKHAESTDQLREFLRSDGGEIIFSTVEKFRLKEETTHPVLSARSNVIIVADEAHRTQYGFQKGFARHLADALPNAKRIGFTGTPVQLVGADTVEVFGDCLHVYDMRQAQEDGAVVPIFYEPRQVQMHLTREDLDQTLQQLSQELEPEEQETFERKKSRWATLAAITGAKARVEKLANDLLSHYLERTSLLEGKAMVVCMSRENCVRMYEEMVRLPNCPEMKIIMTGNLEKDPPEWSKKHYLTTKDERDRLKKRFCDPLDPLKIVIVCDMWLTGTDIPCLHSLYIDKPMHDHNLIQAISRVNRVFRDKPSGLIVDYIGIGDDLKEATAKYAKGNAGIGTDGPIGENAVPLFFQGLDSVRQLLPEKQYDSWRSLPVLEQENLYREVFQYLIEFDEGGEAFLDAELRLFNSYLLVKHLDECRPYADEVLFYQNVRNQLKKLKQKPNNEKDRDKAVKDILDESLGSGEVLDIFKLSGFDKPNVSILDDRFLQSIEDKGLINLRLKLLEKLLRDEFVRRSRSNPFKARSFQEMLEKTLQNYRNRLIDAAAVIKMMIEIKQEMETSDGRIKTLGLTPEELAFYDSIAEHSEKIYEQPLLSELCRLITQEVKKTLKVDWTNRESVRSDIKVAVKKVLRQKKIQEEHFDMFLDRFMKQAEVLYADWPSAG